MDTNTVVIQALLGLLVAGVAWMVRAVQTGQKTQSTAIIALAASNTELRVALVGLNGQDGLNLTVKELEKTVNTLAHQAERTAIALAQLTDDKAVALVKQADDKAFALAKLADDKAVALAKQVADIALALAKLTEDKAIALVVASGKTPGERRRST